MVHRSDRRGWMGVPIFFVIIGYCINAAANAVALAVTMEWIFHRGVERRFLNAPG